jgi:SAM-dependent methyltransferase
MEKDIYPETPMEPHISITKEMMTKLNNLKSLSHCDVLDVGCGQGFALEIFKQANANAVGITVGEDFRICKKKGLQVYEMDQSFLNFPPRSFDIIWCRHAIEHSLFPLFTLYGFADALRKGGLLYVEIPAPNTSAHHENNPNHYSVFTACVWSSLFSKAGFKIIESLDINLQVPCGPDIYHAFFLEHMQQDN